MRRSAQAKWIGRLSSGRGVVTSESGVLADLPFNFGSRFAQSPGTNPEELIAAAHASCFAMALSSELEKSNVVAQEIQTTAYVTLEKGDVWKIGGVHLVVQASVKSADQGKLLLAANKAKDSCPVSKLLNAPITLALKAEEIQSTVGAEGFVPLDQ